jgi:5-methyltetrahydrofolate--homocysteine methyltransferase
VNPNEILEHVIKGDAPAAKEWTEQAVSQGADPEVILNQGLIPGMNVVGEKFKNDEYYVPNVLLSARAMKTSLALIQPLLKQSVKAGAGRVVIGTVQGDLHDIGKNLVAVMLEGAGFEVSDLGTDVEPQAFLQAVEEQKAQLVCLSALLTTTMPEMVEVIKLLEEAEVRPGVKVIVGGAPVTERFASDIGADGYAADAATAVDKAKDLVVRAPSV